VFSLRHKHIHRHPTAAVARDPADVGDFTAFGDPAAQDPVIRER
jgi:hypothetical protein